MTNDRARVNGEAQPAEPVTEWDNERVKGHAFCADYVFREHIEEAQALRDRHAAYEESLPKDPLEAIRAARTLMRENSGPYMGFGEPYLDGVDEALHLSAAIEALIKEGDLDTQGTSRDAALYLSGRMTLALLRATRLCDRLDDMLSFPR